ncbi:MAG: thiolase domain-containing protein [Methanothrix sp.]|nr:thiolase domain-containing protein [Methanothrix sp.]MDD4409673.1 thiolase domain-containing protein [Candidatus Paceibacterota bacterium]
MYVIGIGKTKFGILSETIAQLAYKAMYEAISDSPISINDIGAVYVSNFLGSLYQKQLHLNAVISSLLPGLRIPIIGIETACASGASAFYQGLLALSRFENVLVVGVEKMTDATKMKSIENLAMAGDRKLDQKQGLIFPANYALIAQQHMIRYGTTHDDLSAVSFKNHKNANLNPLAHFNYKQVTMDMINRSPIISSPLNLFDCSPISDGASAVVLSRDRKSDRDVEVIGSDLATDYISLAQRKETTSFAATKIAATNAFGQAKLRPKDLDIVEAHDCFTIAELVAMEDLGICKPGESKDWIRQERTTLNGVLPINTDGGLKADGHPIGASGIAQIYEIVTQLRGEAGKRQVDRARIGLAHNVGGIGGTAVIHILRGLSS